MNGLIAYILSKRLFSKLGTSAYKDVGVANGVAELNGAGKIPTTQLPSYVDDVIEGYFNRIDKKFYEDPEKTKEITPEDGKIYIDIPNNVTYRWGGTTYAIVGTDLALGETSTTAYRGDRGKTAYDHSQSAHARTDATKVEASATNGNVVINGTETNVYTHPAGTNPHGTTASDVGLGNVPNVTTNNQTPTFTTAASRTNINSGETLATLFGKIKKWFTDLKTVAFTGSYNDLSDKPTIPTIPGVVSKTANGLAPKLPNETTTTKYLRQDGSWAVPPDTNTTYSAGSNITLNGTTFSLTKANVTGALGYTPPTTNTTYSAGSNITLNGTTFSLTKANVTGALGYTPPTTDTTYSAGAGISLSGTTFSNSGVRSVAVNIDTSDPNVKAMRFDVNGSNVDLVPTYAHDAGNAAALATNYFSGGGWMYATASDQQVWLITKNNYTFKVQVDGNLVMYNPSGTAIWSSGASSRRFKNNILDMTEERAKKILDIRPVVFDWNEDQIWTTRQKDNAGVIAEEVSQILPDLVVYDQNPDDPDQFIEKRVEYERFTPYLIKLCQIQQREINNLTKRIEALEAKA